ncbi:MAG: cupin domain-containing protein [Actinomycetota bacterium]
MKATPIDLAEAFATLAPLRQRDLDAVDEELESSFAVLGEIGTGGVFVTSFAGKTPWERHPGDELVLVMEGQAELILFIEDREERASLSGGQLIIVPANTWHRFETAGVRVVGVTPQPTETSSQTRPPT